MRLRGSGVDARGWRREPLWLAALFLALAGGTAPAQDLLIANARVYDGTGAPPRAPVSILVREGRIAAIGEKVEAESAPVLNARGATVIPGLIDSHVHLGWGPGDSLREKSPADWGRFRSRHLRAYLACGVTTVLDAAGTAETVENVGEILAAGVTGPRYLTLGPFLRAPGGYPRSYPEGMWPEVATSKEVEAALDRAVALGAVGVKVPIEHGWNPLWRLPVHSPATREAIRREASERGLPVYVHATSEEDQALALDMGARALVHAIEYRSSPLSEDFVKRMAEAGTYQMTTFSVFDSHLPMFRPERLDDPLLRLVAPETELLFARRPDAGRLFVRSLIRDEGPWMPNFVRDAVGRWWFSERAQVQALRRSQEALRRLHAAGVPIVVGSDAPFRPSAVYGFHGVTTIREIELVGEAGLSPAEVLQAATRVAAEMLGLDAEIGTVEVGKHADLVVVREDPLEDLRALRTIEWSVRRGVARTPAEWMAADLSRRRIPARPRKRARSRTSRSSGSCVPTGASQARFPDARASGRRDRGPSPLRARP